MRERLLTYVSEKGTLLEPDAMSYLLSQADPLSRLERLLTSLPSTPLVVTLRDVILAEEIARRAATVVVPPIAASFRRESGRAADHSPDVKILRDITGRSRCEGTIEDFPRYFRHRFRVLGQLLRSRRDLAGVQDIGKARRSTREVRFLGMVSEVRTTRNGHRILDVEDESDGISVLLPSDGPLASEAVVEDEVLGVVGTVNDQGLVIATSLVRPD